MITELLNEETEGSRKSKKGDIGGHAWTEPRAEFYGDIRVTFLRNLIDLLLLLFLFIPILLFVEPVL